MQTQIRLNNYEIGEFVNYHISVFSCNVQATWVFKRRYSAIRALHEHLLQQLLPALPPFPPKKCCGNLRPEFVELRKAALETYFQHLIDIQEVVQSRLFKSFVMPEDRIMSDTLLATIGPKAAPKTRNKVTNQSYEEILERFQGKLIDMVYSEAALESEEDNRKANEYAELTKRVTLQWERPLQATLAAQEFTEDSRQWTGQLFESCLSANDIVLPVQQVLLQLRYT